MLVHYLDRWGSAVVEFLPTLAFIALIVVVTIVVSRRTNGFVQALVSRTHAPHEVGILFGRAARLGVLVIGGLLVLQQLGWQSAVLGFVTGLGVSGIIVGFALQDIVKQFAAGVLLLMLRPFSVGDVIKVSGFEGEVQAIELRATVLKTVDGEEVLIPNADVYTNAVVNYSHYATRRRVLKLKIPASVKLEQAQAQLTQALAAVSGVAQEPPPLVVATDVAADNVAVEARFWVAASAADADNVANSAIIVARRVLRGLAEKEQDGG